MIPSLNERLGKKGYTLVARAPQVSLPQFQDGSWHVVGGSDPNQPETMHAFDPKLISFILSKGGDIVLYRLAAEDTGLPKPVLSRGGMAGRPPDLSLVHSFDPDLVRGLSELERSIADPVARPEPRKPQPRINRPTMACAAAGVALLLWTAAYLAMPDPTAGGGSRWVPDMTNPRDVAITKGATVVVMPREDDPATYVLYRVYPSASGNGARENVGSFKKRDLENVRGDIPDSRVQWRRDF